MHLPDFLLFSLLGLVVGVCLCLALELVGTTEGKDESGIRLHVGVIACLTCLWIGVASWMYQTSVFIAAFDYSLFGYVFCGMVAFWDLGLVVLAIIEMESVGRERGDFYVLCLLLLFFSITWILTTNLFLLVILHSGMGAVFLGMALTQRNQTMVSELVLKTSYTNFLVFGLMALGLFLSLLVVGTAEIKDLVIAIQNNQPLAQISFLFIFVALLFSVGAFPFYGFHVDYMDGSSCFGFGLFVLHGIMCGLVLLPRLLGHASEFHLILREPIAWIATLSALVPAILSTGQRRIQRMCAYLVVSQVGLLLECVRHVDTKRIFDLDQIWVLVLCNLLFALPGCVVGLYAFSLPGEELTFERLSGSWKRSFWIGLGFVYSLASLGGIPGTFGFVFKMRLLQEEVLHQQWWMALGIGLHTVFVMAVVLRVAIFIFVKSSEGFWEPAHSIALDVVGVVVVMAMLGLGVFPHRATEGLMWLYGLPNRSLSHWTGEGVDASKKKITFYLLRAQANYQMGLKNSTNERMAMFDKTAPQLFSFYLFRPIYRSSINPLNLANLLLAKDQKDSIPFTWFFPCASSYPSGSKIGVIQLYFTRKRFFTGCTDLKNTYSEMVEEFVYCIAT